MSTGMRQVGPRPRRQAGLAQNVSTLVCQRARRGRRTAGCRPHGSFCLIGSRIGPRSLRFSQVPRVLSTQPGREDRGSFAQRVPCLGRSCCLRSFEPEPAVCA